MSKQGERHRVIVFGVLLHYQEVVAYEVGMIFSACVLLTEKQEVLDE